MRWYILRTLLKKECRRHLANRGGLAMAGLLVVASLLLSTFGKANPQTGNLGGGAQHCMVDYWEPGEWIEYLRTHVPPELKDQVVFRPIKDAQLRGSLLVYPAGTGAIQIRQNGAHENRRRYLVQVWSPDGSDSTVMAPYESWFWEKSHEFFQDRLDRALKQVDTKDRQAFDVPILQTDRRNLRSNADTRAALVTALVFFALFFICVYLLPSMMCEERERGVLLAQALSPASPREIMAAKFLFYPVVAALLAGLIAGIYRPRVLGDVFFWSALVVSAAGSLGVGLTIASLARTQREASLGAMCYMFAIALLHMVCQQTNLTGLNLVTLEYHCPRMIHAALIHEVYWFHWGNVLAALVLGLAWATLATRLFRSRGWQ
jgi:hypothetical protein